MKKEFEVVVITAGGASEKHRVPGIDTPVNGVALVDLTDSAVPTGRPFVLIHISSGSLIGTFTNPESSARYVQDSLMKHDVDWTLDPGEVMLRWEEECVEMLADLFMMDGSIDH